MGKAANYEIVLYESDASVLVLRDLGPWNKFLTITNDADAVVSDLHAHKVLPSGRRLFYYDSAGERDEILHDGNGKFLGFRSVFDH